MLLLSFSLLFYLFFCLCLDGAAVHVEREIVADVKGSEMESRSSMCCSESGVAE